MRRLLAVMTLVALLPLASSTLSGCSKAADEVIENDPKVSEAKRAEYAEQMKESMQKSVPKGKGPIR